MKKISFNIRTKFNLILIAIISIVVLLFVIFSLSYIRVIKITDFNKEVSNLYNEYLQLRKHEQQFLINNTEDPTFFKTGKNTHFRRFESSLIKMKSIISDISSNNLKSELDINENINDIEEAADNYGLVFNEIVNKIYERGSPETGYLGEINRSFEYAYENIDNLQYKSYLDKISYSEKKFIIEKEMQYYYDFLEKFSEINSFLNFKYGLISRNDYSTTNDSVSYIVEDNYSETFYKEVIQSLNDYKRNFIALVTVEELLGLTSEEGLRSELNAEVLIIENQIEYINQLIVEKQAVFKTKSVNLVIISSIVALLILSLIIVLTTVSITKPIRLLKEYIHPLRKGILTQDLLNFDSKDEINDMSKDINELILGLRQTTEFANKIGEGVYDTNYTPLSDSDELGNSLLMMRNNLQESQKEQEKRKHEDDIRKWSNEGITLFSEIMRQRTKDINELATNVIKNLVNFLEANQGGVFLYNDSKKEDIHLELVASFAYNLERKKHKKIYLGEGLIGTCAIEKAPIYMTDIPNDYITITSGLGGANPTSILIVPLKVEEQILGVIEIASFQKFEKHQIEFTEKVSETIASTLSIAKINQRTAELLAQSQKQAEEMASQEEEMRQNLEELMATQEEAVRREAEMQSLLNAINSASLVFEMDLKGKILNVNNSVLSLFDISEDFIIGKLYADFEEAKQKQLEEYDFWEKLKNGETIQITRKIEISNTKSWLFEVYTPILDADGFTYKILCIANNISKAKEQEEKLSIYAEQMSAQEEELRQNLDELQSTQETLQAQQEELEKSNHKLKNNEQILVKALEKSKNQEKELQEKNQQLAERTEELSAQEEELRQNLEELYATQEQLKIQHEELIEKNSTLLDNEKKLRSQNKEYEEKIKQLNEEIEKLKNK